MKPPGTLSPRDQLTVLRLAALTWLLIGWTIFLVLLFAGYGIWGIFALIPWILAETAVYKASREIGRESEQAPRE